MLIVTVMLAFAAGVSVGFTLGRVFERWEFMRKGYRLPPAQNRWQTKGRDDVP